MSNRSTYVAIAFVAVIGGCSPTNGAEPPVDEPAAEGATPDADDSERQHDDGLACDSDLRESVVLDYEAGPEPTGATPVAAAEAQLTDDFGAGVAFRQTGPTTVEALDDEDDVVGTVTALEVTGGFVVSSFTRCG